MQFPPWFPLVPGGLGHIFWVIFIVSHKEENGTVVNSKNEFYHYFITNIAI